MWIVYTLAVIGALALVIGLTALILNIVAGCDGTGYFKRYYGIQKMIDEQIEKGNINIRRE